MLAAQIGVVAVDPVLPRRIEDVERHRVFERDDRMRNVWRDGENFAGANCDFLAVDEKIQSAFNHVADLLVKVLMDGYARALFEDDAGQHSVDADNILPRDQRIQWLRLNVGPAIVFGFRQVGFFQGLKPAIVFLI